MSESNKALKDFGTANKETFDSFKKTGTLVTGAGIALAGGLGFAVKTAADFESGMSNVQAISGATADDLEKLSDKAREMGSTTRFSATESSEALSYMALAGWETDQMLAGIEPTLDLAAAANMDLARASDIVTDAMSMYAMEAEEASRMTDVMAAASSSTNTDVDQLGSALQYVGANAHASGMDIEKTSAFLGILADNGLKSSKAGTTLNAILRDLKDSAEEGTIEIGDQEVALYDSEGQMRDMTDVVDELIGSMDGMTDSQRDQALSAIMGEQALKGFNIYANEGAGVIGALEKELRDSGGAAGDMADVMQDNLNGALTELKSAFEEILISLGSALLPAVKEMAGWLQKLADWFNGLSDSTKTTIAVVAGIAAALMLVVGPILLLIGFIPSIIAGFSAIMVVLKAVGAAFLLLTSPIGLIVAAVVALGVLIYKYWDEIKEFTIKAWGAIKEFFVEFWESIKEGWTIFVEFLKELWETISETASEAWQSFKEVIMNILEPLIEGVMELFNTAKESLEKIWEGIKTFFEGIWELIKNIFLGAILLIFNLFTGNFEEMKENAAKIWENIKDALSKVWEGIKKIFSGAIEGVKNTVKLGFEKTKNTIKTISDSIRSTLSNIWNGIKSFFTETLANIWATVKQKFSDMVSEVRNRMTESFDKIKEIWGNVMDFFKGIDLLQIGKDIIQGFIDGISGMFNSVKNTVKRITKFVPNFIKKSLGIKSPSRVLMALGKDTSEGLAKGIEGATGLVERATDDLSDAAIPEVDMSYATPEGIKSTLSSAVSGTVDVNAREDKIAGAIASLENKLTNLRIEMNDREFGRAVSDTVTNKRDGAIRQGGRRRI